MEKRHQQILNKHITYLQESLILVGTFYGNLIQRGVFTDEMIEKIQAEKTTSDKIFRLITLLKSAGPKAFYDFITTCDETGQPHIAEKLQQADVKSLEDIPYSKARQVEECIEKVLGTKVMKTINMQQIKDLVGQLVLKVDYQKEKEVHRITQDETKELKKTTEELEHGKEDVNKKLSNALKLLKQKDEDIRMQQQKIKEMSRDLSDKDWKLQDMEDKLDQTDMPRTKTDFVFFEEELSLKDQHIIELKEELKFKGHQYEQMQEELTEKIKENENTIKQANRRLSEICQVENNNNIQIPENESHVLLLHMNIDFISKSINKIEEQLLEANKTIISSVEDERLCLDLLGVTYSKDCHIKEGLLPHLKSFLNKTEEEREQARSRIGVLKERLKGAKKEHNNLQKQLDKLKFDKELMKHSLNYVKEELVKTKHSTTGMSRSNSAGSRSSSNDDSMIVSLPQLPGMQGQYRCKPMHKSSTEPHLTGLHAVARGQKKSRHLSINDMVRLTEEKLVCIICHNEYREKENHQAACHYHPNSYKEAANTYKETSANDPVPRWQCCFKSNKNAIGCCTTKHCSRP